MTFDELYDRHAHDSRARRLLGYYRDARAALRQLVWRLELEGDSWPANGVGVMTGELEQIAAAHVERVAVDEQKGTS